MAHEESTVVPIGEPLVPRKGVLRFVDIVFGPKATVWEIGVALLTGVFGAAAICWYANSARLEWNDLQYAVAAVIAFDIFGGAVANLTISAKRWFHRAGQGRWQILAFVAVHLLHFLLVAWLFRHSDWRFLIAFYGLLIVGTTVVLMTASHLQAPVAMAIVCIAVAVANFCFSATPGFEWFVPLIFIKLVLGHAAR